VPPADVEVVKRLYGTIESRDFEGLQEVLRDDVEWIVPMTLPWGGRRRGFDDVSEGAAILRDTIRNETFERDEYIDVGDGEVMVLGRLTGEGALTGAPFEAEYAHHIKVTDGRVARFQAYVDTAEILKALAEPPAD
jgi:ketosteroid isomerase-like protein